MPIERRKLAFTTFDDVLSDVQNLQAKGYDRAGNWDLAQVVGHLTEWLRYPVEGFPKLPLILRPIFWLMRNTIGRSQRKKLLSGGSMPTGAPTIKETVPAAGGDPSAAITKLRDAIERFKASTGPMHASPLFGALTKDEAIQLQLKHCEHHLSFLVPK